MKSNASRTGIAVAGAATAMSRVRPLHDRLLVRRIEQEETAKGGIIIPDTAKEKPIE